ncbi:hypothetical protein C9E88_016720 (plasmid) [Acinetobacter cumulans]|jgi:hypothetical protein|uniref:Uncharacterized protein n=1 Tax=Acinetobacter tianfuensis TaxID=2419603 RepID=A0A3A8E235_9GAMM|nr:MULTISPECIES: hypothetical protein [Acinetobacter]QCO23157.1 hypothetical protein C9E88_016720 [Acinetobacter cumulans]RKG29067.1 hypothetical protein D7V32_16690 [Acinetobacter tianfuensis]
MKNQCVVVLTARGKSRILKEGGSQAWRLNAHHAGKCSYVVCVQNRNKSWGQPEAKHHTAFLIGKISSISQSQEEGSQGRWIINISEYADISIPNVWDGNRNPVAYRTLEELNIDLENLQFNKLEQEPNVLEQANKPKEELEKISIPEAKRLLANYFDVPQENISITINM